MHGIVYIPADFDTKLNRGEQAHVGVYCDMSLMLTYKAIFQTAQGVASQINSGIQISKGGGFTDRDDEITAHPLEFDEVPIFNTTGGYGNAILPGVLVLILQQTMLLGIGMAAGTSKRAQQKPRTDTGKRALWRHFPNCIRQVDGLFHGLRRDGNVPDAGCSETFRLRKYGNLDHHSGFPPSLYSFVRILRFMLSCLVRYREECDASGGISPQFRCSFMTGFRGRRAIFQPSGRDLRGFSHPPSVSEDSSESAVWVLRFQIFCRNSEHSGFRRVYFLATCLIFRQQLRSARLKANLTAEVAEEEDEAEEIV